MEVVMTQERSTARAIVALFLSLFVLSGCVSMGDVKPISRDPFGDMHGQ
jgi:hypothetical protein